MVTSKNGEESVRKKDEPDLADPPSKKLPFQDLLLWLIAAGTVVSCVGAAIFTFSTGSWLQYVPGLDQRIKAEIDREAQSGLLNVVRSELAAVSPKEGILEKFRSVDSSIDNLRQTDKALGQLIVSERALKREIEDEVDSTYYFYKTFTVDSSGFKSNSPATPNNSFSHFFYARKGRDRVSLSIFCEGVSLPLFRIAVDGGPSLSIDDVNDKNRQAEAKQQSSLSTASYDSGDNDKSIWQDISLDNVITQLGEEYYQGARQNMHNINIRTIPGDIKDNTIYVVHALIVVKRGHE